MSSSIFSSEWLTGLLPKGVQASLAKYAYLGLFDFDRAVFPLLLAVGYCSLMWWMHRSQWRFRLPANVVLWVLLGRVFLWGNPVSWYVYQSALSTGEVGFRQKDVIVSELREYFVPPDELRYLALGSSQTGVVYGEYARQHKELSKIEFAGFGPTEYFLYRDLLERYQPEVLLLYLSEFDLARAPAYGAFRFAPFQGPALVSYASLLLQHDPVGAPEGIREILIGSFFPELRYAFVQKGLLQGWIEPRVPTPTGTAPSGPTVPTMWELDEQAMEISVPALRRFLAECGRLNVFVVIVEGQYAPSQLTEANRHLKVRARSELRALADEFAGTEYVGAGVFRELSESDYQDGAHVRPRVGYEMATQLMQYLDAERAAGRIATNDP